MVRKSNHRTTRALLVSLCLSGCTTAPFPGLKGGAGASGPREEDQSAESYCRDLAVVTDRHGRNFLAWGIVGGVVASGLAIAGASMGAGDGNWAEENRNALVIGAGGVVAVPTTLLLTRAKNASDASGLAAKSMFDDDAYEKCLAARASYSSSRGVVAQAAGTSFDTIRSRAEEALEETVKEEEQQAADAEAEVADAQADVSSAKATRVAVPAADPSRDDALKAEGAAEARLQKAEEAALRERAEADVAQEVAEEIKLKLRGLREDAEAPR